MALRPSWTWVSIHARCLAQAETAASGALTVPDAGAGVVAGDVPHFAGRLARGARAGRPPAELGELLRPIAGQHLGIAKAGLHALDQLFDHLVLAGVLLPKGRLGGDGGYQHGAVLVDLRS